PADGGRLVSLRHRGFSAGCCCLAAEVDRAGRRGYPGPPVGRVCGALVSVASRALSKLPTSTKSRNVSKDGGRAGPLPIALRPCRGWHGPCRFLLILSRSHHDARNTHPLRPSHAHRGAAADARARSGATADARSRSAARTQLTAARVLQNRFV